MSTDLFTAREHERHGRLREAEAAYKRVPRTNQAYPEALLRISSIEVRTGRVRDAEAHLRECVQFSSTAPAATIGLANVLRQSRKAREAIETCAMGLKRMPSDTALLGCLAQCYLDTWDSEKAANTAQQLIALRPNHAGAYFQLAEAQIRLNEPGEACSSLNKCIELTPDSPVPYAKLAIVWAGLRVPEEALSFKRKALELTVSSIQKCVELSSFYVDLGCWEDAEEVLKNALALDPKSVSAMGLLAKIARTRGEFGQSKMLLDRALSVSGPNSEIFFEWAHSGKVSIADSEHISEMEKFALSPDLVQRERERINYALGKAYDDCQDYEKALVSFRAANEACLRQLPQQNHQEHLATLIDRMIEVFDANFYEDSFALGSDSNIPIFIVGVPRSGTTVLEQIISSHPDVSAAGELNFLTEHFTDVIDASQVKIGRLRDLSSRYLNFLRYKGGESPRITDKMPLNALLAGVLHALFPQAKIILCRRDRFDNCLSMFVTPYDAPNGFLHSAENIAFLWKQHERLMRHWETVLPDTQFTTLDYEALIQDREPTIRRLLEFLELPWSGACLKHQDNPSGITTPSQWQARQKLYETSVGRWKNYVPWIEELTKHLEMSEDPSE